MMQLIFFWLFLTTFLYRFHAPLVPQGSSVFLTCSALALVCTLWLAAFWMILQPKSRFSLRTTLMALFAIPLGAGALPAPMTLQGTLGFLQWDVLLLATPLVLLSHALFKMYPSLPKKNYWALLGSTLGTFLCLLTLPQTSSLSTVQQSFVPKSDAPDSFISEKRTPYDLSTEPFLLTHTSFMLPHSTPDFAIFKYPTHSTLTQPFGIALDNPEKEALESLQTPEFINIKYSSTPPLSLPDVQSLPPLPLEPPTRAPASSTSPSLASDSADSAATPLALPE